MVTPDDMKSLMEGFLRASQESTQKMIETAMKLSADQQQRQQQQFEQCTQQMVAAMQQSKGSSASDGPVLVDAKGVAKPDKLTSDVANDLTKFKTWKLKYTNWICAACTNAEVILTGLENDNATEIDDEKFRNADLNYAGNLAQLSAQLRATLVSLCEGEPLTIVTNAPKGDRGGIECFRRLCSRYDPTGPRSAKAILQRLFSTKAVPSHELKTAIEKLETQYSEYRLRAGRELAEDLRMLIVEQLLPEPIKTHCSLNSDRLSDYQKLRDEVVKYSERMTAEMLSGSGAVPMEIGALGKGKDKTGKNGPKNKDQKGKGQEARKFDGECFTCGKKGHRSQDCWHNPKKGQPKGKGKEKEKDKSGRDLGKASKGYPKGKGKGKGLSSLEEDGQGQNAGTGELGELGFLFGLDSTPPWRNGSTAPIRRANPKSKWNTRWADAPWRKSAGDATGTDPRGTASSRFGAATRSGDEEEKQPQASTGVWKPRWKQERERTANSAGAASAVTEGSLRRLRTALQNASANNARVAKRELEQMVRHGKPEGPQAERAQRGEYLAEKFSQEAATLKSLLQEKGQREELPIRVRRDLAAGHPWKLVWKKELSRRRAERHRRQTAKERAEERLDLERQWHEEYDQEQDGDGQARDLGKGLTRRERNDFRQEEEMELEAPKPRSWRNPKPSRAKKLKSKLAWKAKRLARLKAETKMKLKPKCMARARRQIGLKAKGAVQRSASEPREMQQDLLELDGNSENQWSDRMDVVIDTGACASVLPTGWFEDYPLHPVRGRTTFNAANGGAMEAEGSRKLSVTLNDGKDTHMNFTVLPVRRPLAAVSAMVAAGCRLQFAPEDQGGSYVIDRDGNKNKLIERGGVYVLPTWVRSFRRQA